MKNKLFVGLCLLFFSSIAFAQTSDSINYKNQFGIIAGGGPIVGVIYKHQTKTDAAWRLSVSGGYFLTNNNSYNYNNPNDYVISRNSSPYLQALIGYEWQNNLAQRWQLYYGTNIGLWLEKTNWKYDVSNYTPLVFEQTVFQNTSISTQNYILNPFAGVKFKVKPRVYIGVESSLQFNYSRDKNVITDVSFTENQPDPILKEAGKYYSNSFRMGFAPVSNIQIVYLF